MVVGCGHQRNPLGRAPEAMAPFDRDPDALSHPVRHREGAPTGTLTRGWVSQMSLYYSAPFADPPACFCGWATSFGCWWLRPCRSHIRENGSCLSLSRGCLFQSNRSGAYVASRVMAACASAACSSSVWVETAISCSPTGRPFDSLPFSSAACAGESSLPISS